MQGKKALYLMLLVVLLVRLFFAFQTNNFSYDGYATLRQVEGIKGTFMPVYEDELSYGGRHLVYPPLFPYSLAIFAWFIPLWWVLKIAPNIYATLTAIFIYLLLNKLTKKEGVALVIGLAAGIFPLYLESTVSTLTPHTIILPYLLACIYYYLLAIENEKKLPILASLIIIFPFIHGSALFFIGGLFFFWVLLHSEGLNQKEIEKEIFLFSSIYMIWIFLVIFKKALLLHGFELIWQNIPTAILSHYFEPISFLSSFGAIGILPILFGTYIIYKYIFAKGDQIWYLFIGFALFFFAMMVFKLIEPNIGLLYLGTFLFILTGQFFNLALEYMEKTKIAEQRNRLIVISSILFVLSLFIFSIPTQKNHPSQLLMDSMDWIRINIGPESHILATVDLGNLISGTANRKNIWDTSFLMIKNINQRYNDINELFQTSSEVAAVRILSKYRVNYILFSKSTKEQYGIENLAFINDKECFPLAYENPEVKIYKVSCRVKEQ